MVLMVQKVPKVSFQIEPLSKGTGREREKN